MTTLDPSADIATLQRENATLHTEIAALRAALGDARDYSQWWETIARAHESTIRALGGASTTRPAPARRGHRRSAWAEGQEASTNPVLIQALHSGLVECGHLIRIGDQYLDHTHAAEHPIQLLRECRACADQGGRGHLFIPTRKTEADMT